MLIFIFLLIDSDVYKRQVKTPYAFVFGNEGQGVSQEILNRCDKLVKIEMETFESLNVAVAAGICLSLIHI